MSTQSVFQDIFEGNTWGDKESVSGPGSTLEATQSIRKRLPAILGRLGVKTLVDAPCGDVNWIRHLDYRFERYIGVDIVPAVIDRLRILSPVTNGHFQTGNIVSDILPRADAVLCRDCFVHLPDDAVFTALSRFRQAGFSFLIATTFSRHAPSADIRFGEWRPINLEAKPFNLPGPVESIPDNDGFGEDFGDKALGIWPL